tara:strand:+ start:79604 stop:80158 length:555 start_codon:yes stop_codon:yes gene_type:complete
MAQTDLQASTSAAASDFDLGFLSEFIGYHLRLAYDESYRSFAEALGDDALRRGSFGLLCLISKNPGITQIELCRTAGLDKSSVANAMRELEDGGLIIRRRVETDRRAYASELTDTGREQHARMLAKATAYVDHIEGMLGADRGSQLLNILQQLIGALRNGREAGDFAAIAQMAGAEPSKSDLAR